MHAVIHTIGWTLLHFLWQGAVVAVVFALLHRALRGASSQARYLLGCACLALLAVLPAVTAWHVYEPAPLPIVFAVPAAPTHEHLPAIHDDSVVVTSPTVPSLSATWPDHVESALPWLVLTWAIGSALLGVRLIGGWWRLQRMRWCGTTSADDAVRGRLDELMRRLGVTGPVRIVRSVLASTPCVIGWWRPIVLMPAAMMSDLSAWQLDAILAHELAHVRRRDYLVNLLQTLLETLLFYHPAVWWISEQVRREREHCCDDVAAALCDDPSRYARALLCVAEARATLLMPAATGGDLGRRVRRLLNIAEPARPKRRWPAAGGAVLVVALLLCVAASTTLRGEEPVAVTETTGEAAAGDTNNDRVTDVERLPSEQPDIERRIVEHTPPRTRYIEVPYQKLIGGDMRYNLVIRPGDVIQVPSPNSGFVYVMGNAKRPGAYNVPEGGELTLMQLLSAAGGASEAVSDMECIAITRRIGEREVTRGYRLSRVINREIETIPLYPNDVVHLSVNPSDDVTEADGLTQRIEQTQRSIKTIEELNAQDLPPESRNQVVTALQAQQDALTARLNELMAAPPAPPSELDNLPTTPVRPEDLRPSAAAYIIQPGDVVQVNVFGLVDPNNDSIQQRRVDESGNILLQIVGSVQASGLSPQQVEQRVAEVLKTKGALENPKVGVIMLQTQMRTFTIMGEPREDGRNIGTYEIPRPDFRLTEAIALARGISGRTQRLIIVRQEPAAAE